MRSFLFFFKLFKRKPWYILGQLMYSFFEVMSSFVGSVFFLKNAINYIAYGVEISKLIGLCCGVFAFFVISDLYMSWFDYYSKMVWSLNLKEDIKKEIFYKSFEVPFPLYDNKKFLDDLYYINDNVSDMVDNTIFCFTSAIANILNIVMVIYIIKESGPIVVVFAFISVAISFLFNKKVKIFQTERKQELAKDNRKQQYYFGCFFNVESCKDRKLYGFSQVLQSYIDKIGNDAINKNNEIGQKIFWGTFIKNTLSENVLIKFSLLLYLCYKVKIVQDLLYGDFVAAYNGVGNLAASLQTLLQIGLLITQNDIILDKYYSLMNQKKALLQDLPEFECVKLDNISFDYDNSIQIIKNLFFDIRKGEKIALVGKNGSGKTTLINLLAGLYPEYQGKMYVESTTHNKNEIRNIGNKCAFYFQSDHLFDFSVRENVALSSYANDEKVKRSLEMLNYRNYDTQQIYKKCGRTIWQDGSIFSAGEAQKILLSSCLYTDKDIIVLDEPSSNLDPIVERELNELIKNGIGGKTVIFVSHRLSSVLMADRIVYMSDGRISETGSHKELLKKGGEYAKLWAAQIGGYQ